MPGLTPFPNELPLPVAEGVAPRSFDEGDPWGEKRHTYLKAQGFPTEQDTLPGRWGTQQDWVIAELGLGTGCTLASFLASFARHAAPDQHLAYIGLDSDPTRLSYWTDRDRWNQVPAAAQAPFAQVLAAPRRSTGGVHRLAALGGRAQLTLVLGDATEWLERLTFAADAWCLDAFEPAVEQRLWSPAVLQRVAQLTKPGGTAATFSAARVARDGLASAGFEVSRVAGFGNKRHMTLCTLRTPPLVHSPALAPWFQLPTPPRPSAVTVLGAGLAGAWCARSLAQRGVRVRVIEPERPAARASGVPLAAAAQPDGSWSNEAVRVHDSAWHLLRSRCHEVGLEHRVLPIAPKKAQRERLAIVMQPAQCVQALLRHPLIEVVAGPTVSLRQTQGRGSEAQSRDPIIVATGFVPADLSESVCGVAPANPNAGTTARFSLKRQHTHAWMDGGYVLPEFEGAFAWVGSTNHPGQATVADPPADVDQLRQLASRWDPDEHDLVSTWHGTRAASLDHLPMIGPVAPGTAFAHAYGALRHGPLAQEWEACPYLPGVWCSLGHGSHGLLTTVLGAELIADMLFGTPRCIADELLPFLLPQRFALRAIKRARPNA